MSALGSDAVRPDGTRKFQRSNGDLPESPETYWRWGIPSLALGTLTIAFALASQFYVQPRIVSRYEGIVRNILDLESGETLATGVSGMVVDLQIKQNGPAEAGAKEDDSALLDRIQRLNQAELAAQRLVVEQPAKSEYRYVAAQIALSMSTCYWRLAGSIERGDGDALRLRYEQSALAARDRAEDAMRSARRNPGVGSLLAEKWAIREQLNRTQLFSQEAVANLKAVVDRTEELQREHSGDRDWGRFLGRSKLLLGLCPVWDGSEEQRLALVEQAEALFQQCLEKDTQALVDEEGAGFVDRVWLAEAIAARNAEQSVEWAKDSLIHRHAKRAANGVGGLGEGNVEGIDAMFRALLFMGSNDEALAAFESRREEIDLPERSVAQSLLASSCVRVAVLRKLASHGGQGGLNDGKFVRLVMRLAPQASDARALIDAWVREIPEVGQPFAAEKEAEEGEDRALASVLHWLRREKKAASGDDEAVISKIFPEDWQPQQTDADVLVGFVPTMLEWVGKKEITSRRAVGLLDAMRRSAPQNLDLVYASAILALQTRQFERAISDLRRLLDELPGNPQLESLLLSAYENANRSKSLLRKEPGESDPGRVPAGTQ
ncbi:MAG: hypothetical protein ACK5OB_07105 [Pirellula sp.]